MAKAQDTYVLTNALITLPSYIKAIEENIEKQKEQVEKRQSQTYDPLGED